MQVLNYGTVFTKRWVVEMILDLAGYTADRDLAQMVAVEPSCGDGSFLVPMVERLSRSCKTRGRAIIDAKNSIRAFELQECHAEKANEVVSATLISEGWPVNDVREVLSSWIKQADYLLEEHPKGEVDFVIGNPPYIRAQEIPSSCRTTYIKNCKTMTEGTDIYVGFFEVGLRSLKPEGVLAFICADRWMRNAYGKRLRKLISLLHAVDTVLEMHGVDAFAEEVSAYPAITILRAGVQGSVVVASATPNFSAASVPSLLGWIKSNNHDSLKLPSIVAARLQEWSYGDMFWPTGSPARLAVLDDLERRFAPLEDGFTGTKVGIGIATGADRVFIIHDKTVVESDRLLPLVMTSHIRSGFLEWSNTWLVNPWNGNGGLIELDRYPQLKCYLESSSNQLKQRHIISKAPEKWYRTIDKIDSTLAVKPKLLFQDMKASIQPVLDPGGLYPHHNLYWVTSEKWDLEVLGGLLLSKVAQMFIECYAVRMRGGTLRFQSQYLRRICVPDPDNLSNELKLHLTHAFRERNVELATTAAIKAYGLTEMPD
ncbi:MAG TPA: Eco57I restriction-modification methylase domain-containing protein [Candidatus Aquicultor sp.]